MRVNIYAEELTDRVELITKTIDGRDYVAVRFYMELPCTVGICRDCGTLESAEQKEYDKDCACGGTFRSVNVSGAFEHRPGDDDSAAVTFWGKQDLRRILLKAVTLIDEHYAPYVTRADPQ